MLCYATNATFAIGAWEYYAPQQPQRNLIATWGGWITRGRKRDRGVTKVTAMSDTGDPHFRSGLRVLLIAATHARPRARGGVSSRALRPWRVAICGGLAYDDATLSAPEQRGKIIKLLETAMTLAEDVEDETTAYLIERALDEARAQAFTPKS